MNLAPLREMAEMRSIGNYYDLAQALLRTLDALEMCRTQRGEWCGNDRQNFKYDQELSLILFPRGEK